MYILLFVYALHFFFMVIASRLNFDLDEHSSRRLNASMIKHIKPAQSLVKTVNYCLCKCDQRKEKNTHERRTR